MNCDKCHQLQTTSYLIKTPIGDHHLCSACFKLFNEWISGVIKPSFTPAFTSELGQFSATALSMARTYVEEGHGHKCNCGSCTLPSVEDQVSQARIDEINNSIKASGVDDER